MEKVLSKWIEFVAYWRNNHTRKIGGVDGYVKPQFYDFMEWLVNNY